MSKTNAVLDRFMRTTGITIACTPEESRTQQQFKDECDINNIVERYVKTGNWGSTINQSERTPMFGDFANAPDFHLSMDKIAQAKADFDALPSRLRKRFNNDPGDLLAFVSDESNYDEAVKLGLVEKTETPAPTAVGAGDSGNKPPEGAR